MWRCILFTRCVPGTACDQVVNVRHLKSRQCHLKKKYKLHLKLHTSLHVSRPFSFPERCLVKAAGASEQCNRCPLSPVLWHCGLQVTDVNPPASTVSTEVTCLSFRKRGFKSCVRIIIFPVCFILCFNCKI